MAKSKAGAHPGLRLAALRQLHIYISVFVAPSLVFFALTGALQTFRIPDQKTTPMLIQKLARVHKDDVFAGKPERPKGANPGPPAAKAPEHEPDHDHGHDAGPKLATEVLKWFFAAVSVAIALTTLVGVWMALTYNRRKVVVWALLIAGMAAPALILAAA